MRSPDCLQASIAASRGLAQEQRKALTQSPAHKQSSLTPDLVV